MAWAEAADIRDRLGPRFDDVADIATVTAVIEEAAAYIRARLEGVYDLDVTEDYSSTEPLIRQLTIDEAVFRLLRYRLSADEVGPATAIGDIKRDVEDMLDRLVRREATLNLTPIAPWSDPDADDS